MISKRLLAAAAFLALAAGSAAAADMSVKAPRKAPPAAPYNWTGFYFGGDLGVAWAPSSGTLTTTAANPSGFVGATPYSFSAFGPLFGGYLGGNYQINQFVVGLEGDWQYAGVGNTTGNNGANTASAILVTTAIRNYGSVRGRLGITWPSDLFGPALLYVTGGWAWGSYSTSYAPDGAAPFAVNSVSSSGWTVGFGLDYALSENLIMRGEYRYTSLGTSSFSSPAAGAFEAGNKVNINDIRYGLAWKFGGGPVVARY